MAKTKYENVLVDPTKTKRAEDIVALFDGVAKTEEEIRLKEKFLGLIKQDEVDKKDYVEYVYTKLGGLVRTQAEQKVAETRAAKAKADLKKNPKNDEG